MPHGKVCLIEHLPEWVFNIVCPRCQKPVDCHEFAGEEYRFELPGTTTTADKNTNKHFVFDVAVKENKENKEIAFILEVKQTHTCTVEKKKYLDVAWKGKWLEIVHCEDRDDFELELSAREECSACLEERKKIERRGEEQMGFGKHRERTREWVYEHERKYVAWCGKQEVISRHVMREA
jgi:hypothetical protein